MYVKMSHRASLYMFNYKSVIIRTVSSKNGCFKLYRLKIFFSSKPTELYFSITNYDQHILLKNVIRRFISVLHVSRNITMIVKSFCSVQI